MAQVQVQLSDLVDAVRRDLANQDIDSDEEGEGVIPHRTAFQIAADRIASYEEEDVFLHIDDIYVGPVDIDNDLAIVECLQALIESNRVGGILPSHDVDTTTLTFVLDRIVSRMTSLANFVLPAHTDTTFATVEAILQSLRSPRSSPLLLSIEVHYNNRWPLAITEALCDFIMSPSASAYTLTLLHRVGCWISEEAFGRLCAAVQQAPDSLRRFALQNVVINNMVVQEALSLLAHTCAGSPLRPLVICNVERPLETPPAHCTFQLDEVRRALLNLEAVKDSELCITFLRREHCLVSSFQPCWWKSELPRLLTFPLEEWPAILVTASQHDARLHEEGNDEISCSHSSLDILFFLMKVKNDVLLPSAGDNNRDDV